MARVLRFDDGVEEHGMKAEELERDELVKKLVDSRIYVDPGKRKDALNNQQLSDAIIRNNPRTKRAMPEMRMDPPRLEEGCSGL